MKPIAIEIDGAKSIVLGANQPQYNPLPAAVFPTGEVVTRWQLTFNERQAILDGACVELIQLTFNEPLQPVNLSVQGVDYEREVRLRT